MKWIALMLPMTLFASSGVLTQLGTYESVMKGNLAPIETSENMMKEGDFGFGALATSDGAVTVYDGTFYKTDLRGGTLPVTKTDELAYLALTTFKPKRHFDVGAANIYNQLDQEILPHIDQKMLPYAVVITGTFNYLKLSSFLTHEDKKGNEFRNIKGSLVGFYFPDRLKNLCPNGFNFHFISQDRKTSGQVLEVSTAKGIGAIAPLTTFSVTFSQHEDE